MHAIAFWRRAKERHIPQPRERQNQFGQRDTSGSFHAARRRSNKLWWLRTLSAAHKARAEPMNVGIAVELDRVIDQCQAQLTANTPILDMHPPHPGTAHALLDHAVPKEDTAAPRLRSSSAGDQQDHQTGRLQEDVRQPHPNRQEGESSLSFALVVTPAEAFEEGTRDWVPKSRSNIQVSPDPSEGTTIGTRDERDTSSSSRNICFMPSLLQEDQSNSLNFEPLHFDLKKGDVPLVIGRRIANVDNSHKVTFPSKVVSRRHATIWVDGDGGLFIKDAGSSSGTFLNRRRLSPPNTESRPRRVYNGDVLQLGITHDGGAEDSHKCAVMRVAIGEENKPSTWVSHAVELSPTAESFRFGPRRMGLVEGGRPLRVGRSLADNEAAHEPPSKRRSCDEHLLEFNSRVVSKNHAEIWIERGGQPYIRDLRSSSGTFVNDTRLSPAGMECGPYPLSNGDIVQLGVTYGEGKEERHRCVTMTFHMDLKGTVA